MSQDYLFDDVTFFKKKFNSFYTNKKKLTALKNYAEVATFRHRNYLDLMKKCVSDGFLGEKEEEFVGYLLEKYRLNYLDWFHKTNWLKAEMQKVYQEHRIRECQLTIFDVDRIRVPSIPIMPQVKQIARHAI